MYRVSVSHGQDLSFFVLSAPTRIKRVLEQRAGSHSMNSSTRGVVLNQFACGATPYSPFFKNRDVLPLYRASPCLFFPFAGTPTRGTCLRTCTGSGSSPRGTSTTPTAWAPSKPSSRPCAPPLASTRPRRRRSRTTSATRCACKSILGWWSFRVCSCLWDIVSAATVW